MNCQLKHLPYQGFVLLFPSAKGFILLQPAVHRLPRTYGTHSSKGNFSAYCGSGGGAAEL